MWVDGNAKNWQKEKAEYLALEGVANNLPVQATSDARWRDNDELKYALRSAEKYVPWINHIYLVTGFNQVPKWLNTKNPKITVVPHSAIMPASALPTFNSNSIAVCIPNIPDLSEHFLLANDDTFFNRPLKPDYFFNSDGHAIFRYNKRPKKIKNIGFDIENQRNDYQQRLLVSQYKILSIFNKNMYDYMPSHGIYPYHKSTVKNVLRHPLLESEMSQLYRFRRSYQIQHLIFDLYGIIHGTTVPIRSRRRKKSKFKLWNKIYNMFYKHAIADSPCYCTDAEKKKLYKYTPPIVCINDTQDTTDEMREHNKKWLNWKFPEKSSFEK